MDNPEAHAETINQFFALVKETEAKFYSLKLSQRKLEDCMRMIPLGLMFQDKDDKDKVVYQIIAPSGIFIPFKNIDYVRTRREGEKVGTLALTKAVEAGFKFEKEPTHPETGTIE